MIVDVFYDHFLAKNWNDYHTQLLPDYADHVYGVIQKNASLLPERGESDDALYDQGQLACQLCEIGKGIHRALTGMARKISL